MKIFLLRLFLICCLGLTGCAGVINNVRIHCLREETLLKAGFKPIALTEAQSEQMKQFPSFRPHKITTMHRQGKLYYIYPDLNHHRLLVGTNRDFMQYNELVAKDLTPLRKKMTLEQLEWEESNVWDNTEGWESVGWNTPPALAH